MSSDIDNDDAFDVAMRDSEIRVLKEEIELLKKTKAICNLGKQDYIFLSRLIQFEVYAGKTGFPIPRMQEIGKTISEKIKEIEEADK